MTTASSQQMTARHVDIAKATLRALMSTGRNAIKRTGSPR
jgi:hypothetical protein